MAADVPMPNRHQDISNNHADSAVTKVPSESYYVIRHHIAVAYQNLIQKVRGVGCILTEYRDALWEASLWVSHAWVSRSGLMTHICVSGLGRLWFNNSPLPARRQFIPWTRQCWLIIRLSVRPSICHLIYRWSVRCPSVDGFVPLYNLRNSDCKRFNFFLWI